MTARVLHLLSQRPLLTGSGVTLDALVRRAAAAGWDQHVAVGVPAEDPAPAVGSLPAHRVHPLLFGRGALDFPVPGMSDVMPYPSSVWSAMTPEQLAAYRRAWADHLGPLVARLRPDVIHAHHVWLLSSMLPQVAPGVPAVVHCHGTGLRQMRLCPHLAHRVRRDVARSDRILALHAGQAAQIAAELGLDPGRVTVVGAGYRDDLFHARGRPADPGPALLYVGKLASAKGVPWLLDAVERLAGRLPGLTLHVAGTGTGPDADRIRRRMEALAPTVKLHGQLDQPALAALARRCHTMVLPSMFEGLALVLVEALACGCRLVATELPGVVDELAPALGDALRLVPMPALETVDRPQPGAIEPFVDHLTEALLASMTAPPLDPSGLAERLRPFTWSAVFHRVEGAWRDVIAARLPGAVSPRRPRRPPGACRRPPAGRSGRRSRPRRGW